jgi:hypothetical protein
MTPKENYDRYHSPGLVGVLVKAAYTTILIGAVVIAARTLLAA